MAIEIVKTEEFRSKPLVNMTDDMIRATLICTKHDWRYLKRILEFYSKNIYKVEVKYE